MVFVSPALGLQNNASEQHIIYRMTRTPCADKCFVYK